jgi:hypothetical protein
MLRRVSDTLTGAADLANLEKSTLVLQRLGVLTCLNYFPGDSEPYVEDGSGFVYILSSREMPDILKIGVTERSVESRTREINSATGVLIPFGVRHAGAPRSLVLPGNRGLVFLWTQKDIEFFHCSECEQRENDVLDIGDTGSLAPSISKRGQQLKNVRTI